MVRSDPLLLSLDRIIRGPAVQAYLVDAAAEVRRELEAGGPKVYRSLDLEAFPLLPAAIRLIRLFGLEGGTRGPKERHPNSYQRVVSVQGSGSIRIWIGEAATLVRELRSDAEAPLRDRWSGVPPGYWHQPSAPQGDWIALALHTAGPSDLIDEFDI